MRDGALELGGSDLGPQLLDSGGQSSIVFAPCGEHRFVLEHLVQARRAFQGGDLAEHVLRQARGLHAFNYQVFAKGRQPPHLDGGVEDGKQQRYRHGRQA